MMTYPFGVPVRDGFFRHHYIYDVPGKKHVYTLMMAGRQACACAISSADLERGGAQFASYVGKRIDAFYSRWLASNIVWC